VDALDRRLAAVMFTDMVGYTTLIQSDERLAVEKRDRYVRLLERHHAANGGTIVQRLGDGSMSMFPSSLAAVQAAVAMQQELSREDIQVRIGVHVGEVIVEPERLTGEAVNIAARIESFAVPGAVLLSDATYDQIRNQGDVHAVALGRFRLKNVGRPFALFAVAADGVAVPDAAALEGKGERIASLPSNLPEPARPLIGRDGDLDSLLELVRAHRMVTITGTGGVGKTRLVVELGRQLAPEFLDGVGFVSMVAVTDPEGFVPALAEALDVKEAEERTLAEGIAALVGDKKALLLLDNLEQIMAAGPEIASLVQRCPSLHVIATSRAPLRIAPEREYPLAPLALPPSSDANSVEALLGFPSIALFVERARLARSSFALTVENAPTVAAVCNRLDGLPLALELAAARLRLLTPEALLERLGHALPVLTSSLQDVPERQRTLRATIDWSHTLLTESEQQLFRRLAVFQDGCRIEDVETVCADDQDSVLDDLESLVEKALVQVDGQGDRLRLLQTIGEYAREKLEAACEHEELALRHALRYADVVRGIRDGIEGTDQIGALERGRTDEGNIDAALDTFLARARRGEEAAAETGLQMCGDLFFYWHIRGKNLTARDYCAAFLAADPQPVPTVGRSAALITKGLASWILGDFARADEEWADAYRIASTLGADRELCVSTFTRALSLLALDVEGGLRWTAESITRSRTAGFTWAEGLALTFDGMLHGLAGDTETARARQTEALKIQRRLGDAEGAGISIGNLAQLAAGDGDLAAAIDLYRQSLEAFEECGDRLEEARILAEMAWTYLRDGDVGRARRRFLDSIEAYTDVASVRGIGLSLIGLAATEAVEERPETAVQIAAAAEVYAQQEGIVNIYSDETPGREFVERARAALPAKLADQAAEIGRGLSVKQALELARLPAHGRL